MKNESIKISTISIEEIIVHKLPKHKKDDKDTQPIFSETTRPLSDGLKIFFKDKIVNSLISDKALKVVYDTTSLSPIASIARNIIVGDKKNFVENSKKIGTHLFEVQTATNNEGILVVIACKVNSKFALILIKLEMDSGAQLVFNKNAFDINEIHDLMLTKKTKVYKVTLLLSKTVHSVEFDGILADNQVDMKAKTEVKSWYINKFLGCKPYKDPKITTQHFYNYTKAYIDTIDDDILRTKYHQDLNSYILKNTSIISPKQFADDYLTLTAERNNYKNYLDSKEFSFDSFTKDTTQIERRIHKIAAEFANGITIIGDEGSFGDKVRFEKMENGQTKAEIISRVKKIT